MKKTALILLLLGTTAAIAQTAVEPATVVDSQITDAVTQLEKDINALKTQVTNLQNDNSNDQMRNLLTTLDNKITILENNQSADEMWANINKQIAEIESMFAEYTALNAAQHSTIIENSASDLDKAVTKLNDNYNYLNAEILSLREDIKTSTTLLHDYVNKLSVSINELKFTNDEIMTRLTLEDANIRFAFDSVEIDEQGQAVVNALAAFMAVHDSYGLTIAGHADTRGSKVYNIDLGQRRADAIKAAIVALGVSEDRIYTISFGEEVPANPANHDANRRGMFDLHK